MVQIQRMDKGFYLIGELKANVKLADITRHLCSQVEYIEYIGRRITKNGNVVILVRYDDMLYCENGCSGYENNCKIKFVRFAGRLSETEQYDD